MKKFFPLLRLLPWIAVAVIVAIVITTGILINTTLSSMGKNLPEELLVELNTDSGLAVQEVFDVQRQRLDRFLFGVNLLFVSTLGLTVAMVFLLLRQHWLRRREMRSLEALRQAQASLQESVELQTRIMTTMPDIVIRLDTEGTILSVNDIAFELSGYKPSEIVGQNMLSFIDEKDLARAMENALKMAEGPLGPKEYDLIMKDGTRRRYEVNGDLLRDADGTPYGMVQVCRDIAERQRMMEESRKLEERLHRAEKMEALGTLAGGVAHDLNNVLGVLVGYSELMLLEIGQGHPLRKHVTNILDSGQRGAAIIQDLLALARRGVAAPEVVNLNTVIRATLQTPELEKLSATFPGITIGTELETNLLNIQGAPVHLGKTVMNLVFNAVEAMGEKGHVVIRTENRYLDRTITGYDAMTEGDYVVVRVSDTGPGLGQADMDKIFEPFYTKKVMGRSGTGLGLSVVWGTVKDHRGYVDVRSREGEGCEFVLYFPATRELEVTLHETMSPDRFAGKGESILVVDDVAAQREMAQRMLEKIGYKVTVVPSGEGAVEYLGAGNRVDLVVLDMIMEPGIDGFETYRQIRNIHPAQKAIIVSGFSETERVKKAQALGAGTYVPKPYMIESLGAAIRSELDAR